MTKAADIMAAATLGPWRYPVGGEVVGGPVGYSVPVFTGQHKNADARAIVTAVNLFPLYEAVREAARDFVMTTRIDTFDYDDLCAALDALQAAEDAL